MRLLHTAAKTHARFDDPNLVSHAGLVPAVRLAQNIGLEDLAAPACAGGRQGRREPRVEDRFAGGRDGRRRGHHRRDGPAAPRRVPGHDRRDPRPVDAGQLPAGVRPRQRAPARRGAPPGTGRAGRADPVAARRRRAGVHRCRLGAAAGVRGHQAGRGVRARQDRLEVAAGARAERAGRHHQHPAGRAGRGRGPVARRQRRLRAGRGHPGRRGDHHRPAGRRHRLDRGARRLRVLRRGVRRRLPPQRGPVLGHRADGPEGAPRHRQPSPTRPGPRSSTRTRSTTRSPASGSPTPRSPRCPTPRSPPNGPTAPTAS